MQTLADIRHELKKYGHPKKMDAIRYYFNHTRLKMYGVDTPTQRKIAKAWVKEHKNASAKEVLAIAGRLYSAPSFDERLIASYILGQRTDVIPHITEVRWSRWITYIDNWAVSDNITNVPMGMWLLAHPARAEKYLKKLVTSKNIWARRVALVAVEWASRHTGDERWKRLGLAFAKQTMHERDVRITKAVSWILRTLTEHHAAAVRVFVKQYSDELPAIARRETLNKLKSGRKSGKSCVVATTQRHTPKRISGS